MSLNQWIATAVAQKIGAVETAAEFFAQRAKGARRKDLASWLRKVPARPAEPGDEVPEHIVPAMAKKTR